MPKAKRAPRITSRERLHTSVSVATLGRLDEIGRRRGLATHKGRTVRGRVIDELAHEALLDGAPHVAQNPDVVSVQLTFPRDLSAVAIMRAIAETLWDDAASVEVDLDAAD